MYVNVEMLKDRDFSSLDQLLDFEIKNLKKNFADIQIVEAEQMLVNYKDIAKVRHLSGKSFGNFEARAYMADAKMATTFVMSSKTKEGFDACQSPFKMLVTSFSSVTDNLEVEAGDK